MKRLRTLLWILLPVLLLVGLAAYGDLSTFYRGVTVGSGIQEQQRAHFADQDPTPLPAQLLSVQDGDHLANQSADHPVTVPPVDMEDSQALEKRIAELCEAHAAGQEIDPEWAVTKEFCSMIRMTVTVTSPSSGDVPLDLYVAVLSGQRRVGYQFAGPEVVKHTGMLFLYPVPARGTFHMCNVREPLWAFWFRPDGTLLDATKMQPGRSVPDAFCRDNYAPKGDGPYLFTIELGEVMAKPLLDAIDSTQDLRLVIESWMTL